jgi:hypothetical protein
MEFAVSFDYQTSLELLGITLALIGFLNLSEHLERGFGAMRDGVWRFAKWNVQRRNELWPPHKHWRVLIQQALMGWATSGVLVLLVVNWMNWWEPLTELWLSLELWMQASITVIGLILLIPYELTIVFGNATLLAGIFFLLNRVFWLLGLPPSGVTGSIGLILTLVTFVIGRMDVTFA